MNAIGPAAVAATSPAAVAATSPAAVAATSPAAVAAISRDEVADFFDDYYTGLNEVQLDAWPDFFTEECLYRVIPRENYEAGYTLCTMQAESRGMLIDRVMGLTKSQMFIPRYYRRLHSPVRIVSQEGTGVRTRHNVLLMETLIDRQTTIVMVAVCHDHVVPDGGRLRLRERIVLFDSEMVPNSLIYPL